MNPLRVIGHGRAAETLAPEQLASSLLEPEPQVPAEDPAASSTVSTRLAKWRTLMIACALAVPLAGAGVYMKLARPDLLGIKPASVTVPATAPGREMDLDKLAARLAARLELEGGDADAWALLGRAQHRTGRYPEAVDSFTRAVVMHPKDADLLADLADALMMTNGKHWSPKASDAVRRALQVNPVHPKALALSASEQMARADYRAALQSWTTLESVSSGDPEIAREAATGVREASALLGGNGASGDTLAKAPTASKVAVGR
jgi:cytochrome c-type biogenesis protein CcmH